VKDSVITVLYVLQAMKKCQILVLMMTQMMNPYRRKNPQHPLR